MSDCSASLFRQWNVVNAAFSDRIRDYMDAKHKLEVHLSKVSAQKHTEINVICSLVTGIPVWSLWSLVTVVCIK